MRSLEKQTRADLRRIKTEAAKLKWQILCRKKHRLDIAARLGNPKS